MRLRVIASDVLLGLRRNFTMTVSVVITTWVALGFFAAGLLFSQQVSTMKGYWYDKVEVSIYLCTKDDSAAGCAQGEVTPAQRDAISAELKAMPEVKAVYFEDRGAAYKRFKAMFKDNPISENTDPEALPESFRVKLVDPEQLDVIQSKFAGSPGIEEVSDSRAVFQKLFDILGRLQAGAFLVAGATVLSAALLISNTIRVAAYNRRRETAIMRLVGASNFYIQLPFLLEAALAGLLGAALTVGSVVAFEKFIVLDQAARKIQVVPFIGWADVWSVVPWVVVVGVALSAFAALVTLRRHLRV
ncbi:cell division transport system permease protein [Motilibacter rhizosphaerae]|uniref:Cell division protein FtsX n=1 Tax=Motilibacter rhizosphaerae TaxID=598652 RepID=A0A4Q7NUE0_9ACTN|nr:permease-like cell division protein FtsX [Motilibacter rhizosphaerae]RZS90052.1 cell division transport system permease protein [Motilibacter rhizosphaerae]